MENPSRSTNLCALLTAAQSIQEARKDCRLISEPMEDIGEGRYRVELSPDWAPNVTGFQMVGLFSDGVEFFPVCVIMVIHCLFLTVKIC